MRVKEAPGRMSGGLCYGVCWDDLITRGSNQMVKVPITRISAFTPEPLVTVQV